MNPRDKFRLNKAAVKQHEDYTDSVLLETTFEVALAEMLWRGEEVEGPAAVEQQYKLRGAMEFIKIWRGLSETETKPQQFGGIGLIPTDDDVPLKPRK